MNVNSTIIARPNKDVLIKPGSYYCLCEKGYHMDEPERFFYFIFFYYFIILFILFFYMDEREAEQPFVTNPSGRDLIKAPPLGNVGLSHSYYD